MWLGDPSNQPEIFTQTILQGPGHAQAKHLDLALLEKRVALREKATNTRDKRLEFLEFERAKILERAKVAETNVALLTSSLEKVEKQNQKHLEQLRASRKRDVEADRYTNRAYYY